MGTIASRIGDLSFLTFFQIDHNQFIGNIPSEMGQLQNALLFLMRFDITGSIPAEVCVLRNIQAPLVYLVYLWLIVRIMTRLNR